MKMTIGANIKRLRTAKNITQEQLSVAMNVTCAAVSKWERGETYPDITLLQPLAYFFGITLDELMGYNQEKVQAEIDEVIMLYRKNKNKNEKYAREIITKAYHDHPNDFWIMHYYMWNIADDYADNDPTILITHKDEFLAICDKIIEGCTEETLRLMAWDMQAKILHSEGKTDDALKIHHEKFTDWYHTGSQKNEQLFAKDTNEYNFWLNKNMYELIAFAGQKLACTIFYDRSLSIKEKGQKAINYGKMMLRCFDETENIFFAGLAEAFLGQTRGHLMYCGGDEEDVVAILDMNLYVAKKIAEAEKENNAVHEAYFPARVSVDENDFLVWIVNSLLNPKDKRSSELLKNPDYKAVLDKYK